MLSLLLAGCATPLHDEVEQRLDSLLPADAILLGEQHDADAHRELQRAFVEALAGRGQLAALVLEMADRGRSTAALAGDAAPAQVRSALHWNDSGWPWARYAPVVMAAVHSGVPVLGGNLPRGALRQTMNETALDQHLNAESLARQREAIRVGHCDLLPPEQLMPMVRVQLARDASMAATVMDARVPGKVVLLVAGAGHVRRDIGIPTYLPKDLRLRTVLAVTGTAPQDAVADLVWPTPALAPRDHCAELRQQFGR
ncbi:MAG: ChaN family lipoprotein [Burkholderiaceae bacterium]